MAHSVKKLSLGDLILNRKGSFVFRLILAVAGIALSLFFRRIESANAEAVPESGGVIFVMNHPNGLIDPAMVFVALPRRISFLAKSTLFRMPVIASVLRIVGALPLYRRIDPGEDVSKNTRTFELCRELLKKGGSIALFPEGVSHNSPKLLPAKTGAARIALGAVSVGSGRSIDLSIVPVGLYYTSKTTFRSEALVHFGEPFSIEPVALDKDGEPPKEAVKELTQRIEDALRDVTLNAETESDLSTARIAEEVFASSEANEKLNEKLDFLQRYIDERHAAAGAELEDRLKKYDKKLDRHGIEPVHLSLAQLEPGFVIRQAIAQTWWLLLLLPFAIVGAVLHFPAYQICKVFALYYTHHGEDDIVSTVKVLAAVIFMPLTWLIGACVIWWITDWRFALLAVPAGFVLGYIALYTLERAEELRGWAKAIWLFLTQKEKFLRLYVERRGLQQELLQFD